MTPTDDKDNPTVEASVPEAEPTALAARLAERLEQAREGSIDRIDLMNDLAWEIGIDDPGRSTALATDALRGAQALDYPLGGAFARRTLAYQKLLATDLDAAVKDAKAAIVTFEEFSDAKGQTSAENVLGMVYSRLGDYDKALEHTLKSLATARQASDRVSEAWAHQGIGLIRYLVGEFEEARSKYETALNLFRELDYPRGEIRMLTLLGTVAQRQERYDEAIRYFNQSLAVSKDQGMSLGIAGNYAELGRSCMSIGDHLLARRYFERALELADEVPTKEFRASGLLNLAELETEEGNDERARELLGEALALVVDTSANRTKFRIHRALSEALERLGEHDAALRHFKEFHRIRNTVFDEEGTARLRNLEIRLGIEHAEKEAELNRAKFEELARMQAELVRAEKMALLGDFVAGLSHELNTPLGVIKSSSSIVQKAMVGLSESLPELANDDQASRRVTAVLDAQHGITQASDRVSELVSSLKRFARLDEAEWQKVSVADALADTLVLFEATLDENIKLSSDIGSLPTIFANPSELNQVFMTLLVNASQAIDGTGEIGVSVARDSDRILVEITDDGRGIPPERLETLFDIDFQSRQRQVRMRVGLSSALAIIHKHGGDIAVESEVSKGTRFLIQIPLSDEHRSGQTGD